MPNSLLLVSRLLLYCKYDFIVVQLIIKARLNSNLHALILGCLEKLVKCYLFLYTLGSFTGPVSLVILRKARIRDVVVATAKGSTV